MLYLKLKKSISPRNYIEEADKMPHQFTELRSNWTKFLSEADVMKGVKAKRREWEGLIQFAYESALTPS